MENPNVVIAIYKYKGKGLRSQRLSGQAGTRQVLGAIHKDD